MRDCETVHVSLQQEGGHSTGGRVECRLKQDGSPASSTVQRSTVHAPADDAVRSNSFATTSSVDSCANSR